MVKSVGGGGLRCALRPSTGSAARPRATSTFLIQNERRKGVERRTTADHKCFSCFVGQHIGGSGGGGGSGGEGSGGGEGGVREGWGGGARSPRSEKWGTRDMLLRCLSPTN